MADLMEPVLHSDYAWSAFHSRLAIGIGYAAQVREAARVRTRSPLPTSRAQDLDGALKIELATHKSHFEVIVTL
jgi:hypothetical protein